MSRDVVLISHQRMLDHMAGGEDHPEQPDRLRAILQSLRGDAMDGTRWLEARPASRQHIERIHPRRFIEQMDRIRGKSFRFDEDTMATSASVDAAYLACGAAVQLVDTLMTGEASGGFALVRPPGHHAEPMRAMGFCLFNNIAVAAAHAIESHGCQHVLVIDWDVHHGNGTQAAFYDRRDVLFASLHQWPFYPGGGAATETGIRDGEGFTVNVPLPAGCDDGDYLAALRELIVPIADACEPQLLLVSAGFDAHLGDPLAEMRVTTGGFAAMCGLVRDLADRHAHGRLGLVLEGGYHVESLVADVRACVEVLAGAEPPVVDREAETGLGAIRRAQQVQRRFWSVPAAT